MTAHPSPLWLSRSWPTPMWAACPLSACIPALWTPVLPCWMPPRDTRSALAASCRCTPTTGRILRPFIPAILPASSVWRIPPPATRSATRSIPLFWNPWSSPSLSSVWPLSPRPRPARKRWASPWWSWPRRTPPSAPTRMRRQGRPSSPAWASCTWRSSWTACCGSTRWKPM